MTKPIHVSGRTHPTKNFAYDGNGNMISCPAAVNGTPVTDTLTYDGDNHLVQQAAGETQVRYSYDGDGKLISKSNGGSRTIYIGNYLEVEYNPTATPTPPVHATWTPTLAQTPVVIQTRTGTPLYSPTPTRTWTPSHKGCFATRTPTKTPILATSTKTPTPSEE